MDFVCKVNLTVSCFTTNASRVGHTSPVNKPLLGGWSALHKECCFRNAHLTAGGVRPRLHQWSKVLSIICVGSIWKLKQINGLLPLGNVAGCIQWRKTWHSNLLRRWRAVLWKWEKSSLKHSESPAQWCESTVEGWQALWRGEKRVGIAAYTILWWLYKACPSTGRPSCHHVYLLFIITRKTNVSVCGYVVGRMKRIVLL